MSKRILELVRVEQELGHDDVVDGAVRPLQGLDLIRRHLHRFVFHCLGFYARRHVRSERTLGCELPTGPFSRALPHSKAILSRFLLRVDLVVRMG